MAYDPHDPLSVVTCDLCGSDARLVYGRELWGEKCLPRNLDQPLWRCDPCDAHVSAHRADRTPMGSLAGPETRNARIRAHKALDARWAGEPPWRRKAAREETYRWLAGELGVPLDDCHIGMFDDETCRRVEALCDFQPWSEALRTSSEDLLRRFVVERCVLGPTLVVPLRVVHRELKAWCSLNGWEAPPADDLVDFLRSVPWSRVRVRGGGEGRLRSVVDGLGVLPLASRPAA